MLASLFQTNITYKFFAYHYYCLLTFPVDASAGPFPARHFPAWVGSYVIPFSVIVFLTDSFPIVPFSAVLH